MKSKEEINAIALQVISEERKAVENLSTRIGDAFYEAVRTIFSTNGRVVVTGIGKSANIATKIVSTFNSTGTPAVFMHAADAIHGDLGIIRPDDVVICLSKSGNTPEIKVLLPLVKNFGNTLIAIVGNRDSFLAREADIVLDVTVEHEACPNNLAPTSSTTAQLVMGDALAVALIECRNFSAQDFARFHPGGTLGKQLYMRVNDLYTQNESPVVYADTPVRDTIIEMTTRRLGCTAVLASPDDRRLRGIVTDGDLRRMLKGGRSIDDLKAADIMTTTPKCIAATEYVVKALALMRSNSITQLLVLDNDGNYVGVLHIHDILREGII
ncbi:MAG: KpsF/GutQ family sugar-phosphate isomerase [Bacteroidales bacterium]|nr:KpsF/GutQ family sugar-phosphate isomerase [Bacteroidales bacterium]